MIDILKQRPTEFEIKKYALQLMEKTHSFAYTRNYLVNTERDARQEILKQGGNVRLEAILDFLRAEYVSEDGHSFERPDGKQHFA